MKYIQHSVINKYHKTLLLIFWKMSGERGQGGGSRVIMEAWLRGWHWVRSQRGLGTERKRLGKDGRQRGMECEERRSKSTSEREKEKSRKKRKETGAMANAEEKMEKERCVERERTESCHTETQASHCSRTTSNSSLLLQPQLPHPQMVQDISVKISTWSNEEGWIMGTLSLKQYPGHTGSSLDFPIIRSGHWDPMLHHLGNPMSLVSDEKTTNDPFAFLLYSLQLHHHWLCFSWRMSAAVYNINNILHFRSFPPNPSFSPYILSIKILPSFWTAPFLFALSCMVLTTCFLIYLCIVNNTFNPFH